MTVEVKKGTELRNRYVVSDHLGTGGFATVWRATDKDAGRDVAIKRMLKIDGSELQRLMDEAKKTSRLKGHKNIVEVYEVFEQDGEGFLVMEYVDGKTLDHLFREHILGGTWLDTNEALDYFKQIMQGLLFAHSSGLYHRDIKPSNILVSKVGVIKVVDFGLARPMLFPELEDSPALRGFAWSGTPNFMSPEQASGGSLDHLTDIFSAGMVGYILLTGQHPFNHPSGVAPIFDLIKEPNFDCERITPTKIDGLSDEQRKALIRMLSKNKTHRCQSLVEPLNEFTKEAAQACPRCGSPNLKTNKFCGECGNSLTASVPSSAASKSAGAERAESAVELTDRGYRHTRFYEWKEAIKCYYKAIEVDPYYARAFGNLGYALNRMGDYEEAITATSEGLECASESVDFHRLYDTRGFARSNLKDFDGAIEDFTKALEYNSDNPRVYYHRAESRILAERYADAYQDVMQALRIDPEYEAVVRLKNKLESLGLVKSLVSVTRA